MNSFVIIGIVIILCIIIVVSWVIKGQNRLVRADELCGNALSQIGVQQASRWDALTSLAGLCKSYSDHEYQTLMDTIQARQTVTAKTSGSEVRHQEQLIIQSFDRIHALAEAYPDLKSNTIYIQTMDSINQYEDKVRMSRMVYNDTVTKYNRLVRALPGSLVAKSLGFGARSYLEEDTLKSQMPAMDTVSKGGRS